jgi:2-desacetyl-2-hydroxyethyl bacteriochlorophyllide A dehydrogenase
MRALVWNGNGELEIRDVPRPEPGPGETLVRVRAGGVCGTDLSILAGKHPRAKPPLVMGHEFSGEVVSANGPAALGPGARVTCEPLISCGTCVACRSGFAYVCQNLKLYGIDTDGAFAEYVTVASDSLFALPDGVSFELGALVEPVAVAVHAVRMSSLRVGDTACVLGGGPIGLLTALVARLSGPERVIVCEKDAFRIDVARGFGLEVIDVNEADPEEEIPARTDGRGADVVFEVAGAPETVLAAPRLCRVRGELIAVAMPKVPRPFDIVALTFREITVRGIRVYAPYDFERATRIVAESGLDLGRLQSEPFALEDGVAAFARAKEGAGIMRVLVTP